MKIPGEYLHAHDSFHNTVETNSINNKDVKADSIDNNTSNNDDSNIVNIEGQFNNSGYKNDNNNVDNDIPLILVATQT